MARKRLTKKQKAHNRAESNRIRREYDKIKNPDVSFREFKKMTMGMNKGTGESLRETARKLAHGRAFTSASDVAKENLLAGMKESYRDVYDDLLRKAGKYEKGQTLKDKIEWSAQYKSYLLKNPSGKTYIIDISDSPKSMSLIEII